MTATSDAVNGVATTPDSTTSEVTLELPLVENSRWCALDLDELLEHLVLAGRPPELICTYKDPGARRRYVRLCLGRKQVPA